MKKLMLFALLGGLSLVAPAQTAPENAVTIHGYSIELPVRAHTMLAGDFDEYKGGYDLSNGGVLTMYQRGRRMFAAIGDGPAKELVAAAPNVFVALDRQLKITLNHSGYDDFTGELLMVVPATSAQANAGQVIRLVAAK